MALPTSRNTTYAIGSQVLSADLNDIQDQIIALESARVTMQSDLDTAEGDIDTLQGADVTLQSNIDAVEDLVRDARYRVVSASAGAGDPVKSYWDQSMRSVRTVAGQALEWTVPLTLETSQRLLAVHARVTDGGSGKPISMAVMRQDMADGSEVAIGSDTSSESGAIQTLEALALDEAVTGTKFYYVNFSGLAGSQFVYGVWYQFDNPE